MKTKSSRRRWGALAGAAAAVIAALVGGALYLLRQGPPDRMVRAADGVPIVYRIEGHGRPVLVFIHGWSCDRSFWAEQVRRFSAMHKVVAVDLAGHGASGAKRKNWTIPSFGADVADVLIREGLKDVILVGHSMGGEVSLETARLVPGRVLGIVGVDTFQDFSESMSREEIEIYLAPFKADFKPAADMFARAMFPWGSDQAVVERVVRSLSAAPPSLAIPILEAVLSYQPAETLKKIRVPIVCINSDKTPTNAEGNRKRASAPFSLKAVTGRGHFLFLEDPAGFDRLLERAIAEISGARR